MTNRNSMDFSTPFRPLLRPFSFLLPDSIKRQFNIGGDPADDEDGGDGPPGPRQSPTQIISTALRLGTIVLGLGVAVGVLLTIQITLLGTTLLMGGGVIATSLATIASSSASGKLLEAMIPPDGVPGLP